MKIRGRDLATGLPKMIIITSTEIRKALSEPVNAIVDAIKSTLEQAPPELAADIMDKGIMLTKALLPFKLMNNTRKGRIN